ncbi:MAG: translation elongation factor-like protein [Methanonatronarchaeia archaeon]|nr:MAG: translation elongation factor-like protein [Methanonatronarchaeia archaeon]
MGEKKIGEVTHFYTDISVGIISLSGQLELGNLVKFKGSTTDFEQTVDSIQIEHEDVERAGAGDEVGVKVDNKVRESDEVYLIE